jgi:predicted membrane metal-binding protein
VAAAPVDGGRAAAYWHTPPSDPTPPLLAPPLLAPPLVEPLLVPPLVEPLLVPPLVEPLLVPPLVEPLLAPLLVPPLLAPPVPGALCCEALHAKSSTGTATNAARLKWRARMGLA